MKNLVTLAFLAFFVSCEEDPGYEISGTVDVPDGQEVYISELNKNNNQTSVIDTVEVKDGKFQADLPEKENPTLSFLTVEGVRGNVLYIADNTPIAFEIHKDSMYASNVTGGADNEILYNYLESLRSSNRKMMSFREEMMAALSSKDTAALESLQLEQEEILVANDTEKVNLIEENPNSIVSLLILQEMINSRRFSATELKELFESIAPKIRETSLGEGIKEMIDNLSKVAVGSKAPLFSGPSPTGEEIALQDVMGEVTLIDFWASWCKPCREENPNIVKVYEKYHDQGFNIIGVSLDKPGEKEAWTNAIKEDNLTWNQVSNLMFWQDPIALEYGVRAIPAAFLLDENGVIVAKNLRGQDLENKVAELLEKK